jgi:formate dehydrogenase major subunit
MQVSRRGFLKLTASGIGATTVGALGFSAGRATADAALFKLTHASETRNTCPYCSVGCGIILYGLGDRAKNARTEIIHVEGDPDHPVNRGTLCPKGASLLDFVHSPNRLRFPEYRAPGSREWKRVSWEWSIDRIARLMKEDRDRNFVATNAKGQRVNRWPTTAVLAASASSNETGYVFHKVIRALGGVAFDNQARV